MRIHTFLLFAAAVLPQAVARSADDDYPQRVCWVVADGTSLALGSGERLDLDVGDMLAISVIEGERLLVSRLHLQEIEAVGWVARDHVADCCKTIDRLGPTCAGKAWASHKPYVALAQAHHTAFTSSISPTVGSRRVIEQCLDAAERLAPDSLEVLWERAILSWREPAPKRVALWDSVIARAPDNAIAFYWRAVARQESDNREGAIDDFRKCIDLFGNKKARYLAGTNYVTLAHQDLEMLLDIEQAPVKGDRKTGHEPKQPKR